MGRASLIVVFGASIVLSIIVISMNKSSVRSVDNMVHYYNKSIARVIANEGMSYLLTELADSATWRVTNPAQLSSNLFSDMGSYTAYYTIQDDSLLIDGKWRELVKLYINATYPADNGDTQSVMVYADRVFGFKPATVRGAWTANDVINKTISDMQIDGRDHDLNWNVIPNKGVCGVSTSVTFVNTENAMIGGTKNGVDYAPSYPENPAIIEQNYNWGGTFPDSPDKALGYSDGYLKQIAQSGLDGSQYVTNPSKLKFPLKGVTYVEIPSGVVWTKANLGVKPKGILIVHNSSLNASALNLTTPDKSAFQGIIIGDYMFHIHMDILGGIILLSPHLEQSKECQGNKDHKVFYSSQAIINATSLLTQNGTGSQGRVPVIAWRE